MKKKYLYRYLSRVVVSVISIIAFTLIFGCSPSHILRYEEDVSRDYTYIDFARNTGPFNIESQVGGEHIKYIKILGFEGDKFLINFKPLKGEPMYNLSGQGFDTKKCRTQMETVFVRDLETIISLALSAHPYGEYSLTITKL
jgi:hypothetical protein